MNNTAHGLAIDTEGRLWSWGRNDSGQLGRGTTNTAPGTATQWTPSRIARGSSVANADNSLVDLAGVVWVNSIAGGSFSLAVNADGELWAWGHNEYGQLGNGFNGNPAGNEAQKKEQNRNRPVRITGGPAE